ncbi:Flp family type IVb pilin [Caulobacter sp. RHG1]|uniref:Flp family type IVb pilin n=1 Tax=Caulobacter sp. (strain RHG1) TaxID=2545762 RepID=UPI001F507076|nr:Flp family type IVb pilin [Caulobacter sp. RHG1]NQE64646.1 hypothetical protein [Caulobacter sp. RHG1]
MSAFWADSSGATAVELGIMVAVICVMLISALGALGGNLNGVFTKLSGKMA